MHVACTGWEFMYPDKDIGLRSVVIQKKDAADAKAAHALADKKMKITTDLVQ